MKQLKTFCRILGVLMIGACSNEISPEPRDYPFIVLHEITEVSESGVELTASVEITDVEFEYGFLINTTGDPTIVDRMILVDSEQTSGTISYLVNYDLINEKQYFVRAFVKTPGLTVYTSQKSFYAKGGESAIIYSLNPEEGTPGTLVTIKGEYFSENIEGIRVFFNELQANVISSNKNEIIVQCPNSGSPVLAGVSVEVAEKTVQKASCFNLFHPWNSKSPWPGEWRSGNATFTIGKTGYMTLGSYDGSDNLHTTDLLAYNIDADRWSTLDPFPGFQRYSPVGCAIEGKGYVGLGKVSDSVYVDLWSYDPLENNWERKSDFPYPEDFGYHNPFFDANGELYVYMIRNSADRNFWKYNPLTDQWLRLENLDELDNRSIIDAFSYNDMGYFVVENKTKSGYKTRWSITIWEFDPERGELSQHSSSDPIESNFTDAFSTGNGKIFVQFNLYSNLMEYDINTGLFFIHSYPYMDSFLKKTFELPGKAYVNKYGSSDLLEFSPK